MADQSRTVHSVAMGTVTSARALLEGMCVVVTAEFHAAQASGDERAEGVLICVLADLLDAQDALGE